MKRIQVYAALACLLLLLTTIAGADSINTVAGIAGKDTANIWSHAVSVPLAGAGLTGFDSDTSPQRSTVGVVALLVGCSGGQPDTATCGTWSPILQQDPDTDVASTSNNGIFSPTWLFDGTNMVRGRAQNASNLGTGVANSGTMISDGTNWNRSLSPTADAAASTGLQAAAGMVFNGTTWDRIRGGVGETVNTTGMPSVVPHLINSGTQPLGGAAVNHPRGASANALAYTVGGSGAQVTVPYSTWSVTNTPAAATQATASQAAGAAGVRHVATTVTVCLAAGGTAQTPILAHLRDGATGAGTILRSWAFSAPVNTAKCDNLNGLAMLGTAATAMTIEFTGAGVASSQQTVTLTGFSTQ